MREIDCRGLACPAPVLRVKEAIEKDGLTEITILVDNEAAKQNVSRFMETKNFNVTVKGESDLYYISGTLAADAPKENKILEKTDSANRKILVMVTSNTIGHGDDELGEKLMVNFLKTIKEMGDELWRIVFVNSGVKLTINDSPALEDLKDHEKNGIQILVCGTCLNHFNLLDKKQVGETTNMLDIVTAMQVADKVITF